jgi:hypothetical protein
MRFTCKNCKKCFNRNFELFSTADKKCDFCQTEFVMQGITPESKIVEETKVIFDASFDLILDTQNPWFHEILDLHKLHSTATEP